MTRFVKFSNVYHSNAEKGLRYETIDWEDYHKEVLEPPAIAKADAPCCIFSSYNGPDARSHKAQYENGQFVAIWADIDAGDPTALQVQQAVEAVAGNCFYYVFCSPSYGEVRDSEQQYHDPDTKELLWTAQPGTVKQKYRVVIPLASPVAGQYYRPLAEALNRALAEQGLYPDDITERHGQYSYRPTRPPAWHPPTIGQGPLLDPTTGPLSVAAAAIYKHDLELEANRVLTPIGYRNDGDRSPIAAFLRKHAPQDVLEWCGFVQSPRNPKDWRHPYAENASYPVELRDDGSLLALNGTAPNWGGRPATNRVGHYFNDVFDIFVYFAMAGDRDKALAYARQCLAEEDDARYGGCVSGAYVVDKEYVDPATGEVVPVGHYPIDPPIPGSGWDILRGLWIDNPAGDPLPYGPEAHQLKAQLAQQQAQQQKEAERKQLEQIKEAQEAKWGGDWTKHTPFAVDANALEWAAWHAPGVLGEIVRAKACQATRYSGVPLLAGALAGVCWLSQGKVMLKWMKYRTPPALMMYLSGDTGSGKGDAVAAFNAVRNIVDAQYLPAMSTGVLRKFGSAEAVTNYMSEQKPNVLLIHEEAGGDREANRTSSRHASLANELTAIYTAFEHGTEAEHNKVAKSSAAVGNPTLSAMLLTTPGKLFKTISGAEAESGWLGRYLFLNLRETPKQVVTAEMVHYPSGTQEYINRLAKLQPPEFTINDDRVWNGAQQSYHALRYSDEANEFMLALDREYDEKARDHKYSGIEKKLYSRALEAVSRLSVVAGIADNVDSPISLWCCQWAAVVVEASLAYATSKLEHASVDEDAGPQARLRQATVGYFRKALHDKKVFGSFGTAARINSDGQVELGLSMVKRKLREGPLRTLNINTSAVNTELDAMFEDGIIINLGPDISKRVWIRLAE